MRQSVNALICCFLAACGLESAPKYQNFDAIQAELKRIHTYTPYSDTYLKARSSVLDDAKSTPNLTKEQQQALDYLRIEERFPARFLALRVQYHPDMGPLSEWLAFQKQRLAESEEQDIAYSRKEKAKIAQHLDDLSQQYPQELDAINALQGALTASNSRFHLGLLGITNGAHWYQHKVNYFSQKVQSPEAWLNALTQTQLAKGSERLANLLNAEQAKGVDFEINFLLPSQISTTKTPNIYWQHRAFIDLNVHYYGWDETMVCEYMLTRLPEDNCQAVLLETIKYPALSFQLLN